MKHHCKENKRSGTYLFLRKGEGMVGAQIRTMLLATALFSVPFASLKAFDWIPVGTEVGADGFVLNEGVYEEGDRVLNTKEQGGEEIIFRSFRAIGEEIPPADKRNHEFEATNKDGVLDIYGYLNGGKIKNNGKVTGTPASLKIDGDVTLTAKTVDMTVNIKTPTVIEPYYDPTGGNFPAFGGSQIVFDVAQGRKITVNVDHDLEFRGRTAGVTTRGGGNDETADLILTFKGRGQTVFRMADGTSVKFNGQVDTDGAVDVLNDNSFTTLENNAGGTKVFLVMDQTKQDVDSGLNKLTFERKTFGVEEKRVMVMVGPNSIITSISTDDTGLAHEADATLGGYSSIAFDPSNQGGGRMVLLLLGAYTFNFDTPGLTREDPEFFKIAFAYPFNDASVVVGGHHVDSVRNAELIRSTINYSRPAGGQMFFRVTDDLRYRNRNTALPYDPAAAERNGLLVVNDTQSVGKHMADPYWDLFNGTVPGGEEEIRSFGGFRSMSFDDDGDDDNDCDSCDADRGIHPFNPITVTSPAANKPNNKPAKKNKKNKKKKAAQRALKKAKHVRMVRILPMNPVLRGGIGEEGPATILGHDWAASLGINEDVYTRNSRTGFVVAVNGVVDVAHQTFLDYAAGSTNKTDLLAQNDFTTAYIMHKNPSALVIDGLDSRLFVEGLSTYAAANPANGNPRRASLFFRGNGSLFLRSCASSSAGYITALWDSLSNPGAGEELAELPGADPADPAGRRSSVIDNPDFEWDAALAVAEGTFDGYNLGGNADVTTKGVGQFVLDVEGHGVTWGFPNTSIIDPATGVARNYATTVANAGVITMPTLAINSHGFEFNDRPLVRGLEYLRYNSPAIMLNNNLSLFNTTVVHSDVTKLVTPLPSVADPALVGGERFYFASQRHLDLMSLDRDRYRFPELQLFNGGIDMQESLAMAGVRLVVKDGMPNGVQASTTNFAGQAGSNTSVIRFFDHGDVSDTNFSGYGRMLLMGATANTMADGMSNLITESCYLNVFRHNKPSTVAGDASGNVVLSFRSGDQFPDDVPASQYYNQRAAHLVVSSLLPKGSTNIALGWTDTAVLNGQLQPVGDSGNAYPYRSTMYPAAVLAETLSADPANLFTIDANVVPPATISVDGYGVTFTSFDSNGHRVRGPINRLDNPGVLYVNHGGKLSVTRPAGDAATSIPFDVTIDTYVANKVWNDYDLSGVVRTVDFTGRLDLPHDQSDYTENAAVQPYGFTDEMLTARANDTGGFVRLSFLNQNRSKYDQSGAAEVVINWFNRQLDPALYSAPTTRGGKVLPKTTFGKSDLRKKMHKTRATETVLAPQARPDILLYVGSGDDITQLRVAGATKNDPFVLEVSGDELQPNPGRVREFVTTARELGMNTDHFVGEGDHAVIFVEFGGRIGLGSRNWDQHSGGNSWNLLGKDHIQIRPRGDGVIDLNTNLIVTDSLALVADDNFSFAAAQRLTFYSETEKEIRVPAGCELDLSSFGQAPNLQQIAFGGKTKLVFEAGAAIRFPQNPVGGVVLYFNDQSQLVFEGTPEQQVFTQPFLTSDNAQKERIKIIGQGQIWGNKTALISVNGSAMVGVQSDAQTPTTNVIISLQRESQLNIGTATLPGGAFEVGNPTSVPGGSVNFTLQHFNGNPRTTIERQGFLGLAAGVIDKHGTMNGSADPSLNPLGRATGTATLDAAGIPLFTPIAVSLATAADANWTVQALNDVNNITLRFNAGTFSHNNIARGDDTDATLLAVGPANSYQLDLNGPLNAQVLGGGNLMFVPAGATNMSVNVWDYAGVLQTGEQYSVLASAPLILDRAIDDLITAPVYQSGGRTFAATTQADFFNVLAPKVISTQPRARVSFGESNFQTAVDFTNFNVNAGDIYPATAVKIGRIAAPTIADGRPEAAFTTGTLAARSANGGDPAVFALVTTN